MRTRSLYHKLASAQAERQSDCALFLSPVVARMPLPIAKYDDPFLPFGKAIIGATRDLVCAYAFDLAAYLALGAAGAVALERTIAYAGADGQTVTILHAPFASAAYAEAASDRAFNVDAVTITRVEVASAYTRETGSGAFVVSDATQLPSLPAHTGHFLIDKHEFTLADADQPVLRVRLLGSDVLYAGSREDFETQVRAAVERRRSAR